MIRHFLVPPVLLILLAPTILVAADYTGANSLFNEANEAYTSDNFQDAIQLYRKCLGQGQSSAVHFNLANAYFMNADPGHSILHYEKSLALNPNHPEATANLAFVRKKYDLKAPESSLLYRYSSVFSLEIWSWAAAGAFWTVLGLILLLPLFRDHNAMTRTLTFLGFLILSLSLAAIYGYQGRSMEAVVLQDETVLRVAPTSESPPATYLRSGEMTKIRKTHEGFLFLVTDDGESGWVEASDIGKIWE